MEEKGISREFSERVFEQIRGFGEYGFPECIVGDTRVIDAEVNDKRIEGAVISNVEGYRFIRAKAFIDATEARRNRVDDFYTVPAGHIDLCNVPLPVRAPPAK